MNLTRRRAGTISLCGICLLAFGLSTLVGCGEATSNSAPVVPKANTSTSTAGAAAGSGKRTKGKVKYTTESRRERQASKRRGEPAQ